MFVDVLKEASEAWNIRISAYCLMPNHYHLLVQTPDAFISRSMRHVNGVYTQRFNRKHGYDGHLFRGRYKSIIVDADSYLLQFVRYIHSNPSSAGPASTEQYEWSSHKGYLSAAKKWDWLFKTFVYRQLTENKKAWVRTYRQFMAQQEDGDLAGMIEGKKWPSILGGKSFTDWIKGRYYDLKKDPEVPQFKELAPSTGKIISTIYTHYSVPRESLYQSKRGEFNEPRCVALLLMRRIRKESLKSIAEQFLIRKYSTVSSAIERLKNKMDKDRRLKRRVDKLSEVIIKGQGQT